MTVGELKAVIAGMNDQDRIEVAVRVYTKPYAVAYVEPLDVRKITGDILRMTISLPEGYVISKRKGAKD
jgi:hypothetical protein